MNEAIAKAKDAPEEESLCDLGRRLGEMRKELVSLGRVLIRSQDLSLAAEAHDLCIVHCTVLHSHPHSHIGSHQR